jgi:hypothetical protein
MTWKEYLKIKNNRIELAISIILIAVVLVLLTNFLNFVERRQGVSLPDPILNLFNPINLTWLIFALIYISLVTAIITLAIDPQRLIFALQLYTIMIVIRMIAMFILPLEPPQNMIALNDPFVEFFGSGKTLTKDLFFSGHTATLFILFLVSDNKIIKNIFLASTIVVAIAVLLQHVHYSIDVFAAVFFVYAVYNLLKKIKNKKSITLF